MSGMNLFQKIRTDAIDLAVCKALNIPKLIYEKLPGLNGEKFFTEEEYKTLRFARITNYDLLKNTEMDKDMSRKTLLLNSLGVLKCISYSSSFPMGSGTIKSFLEVGGAKNGQIDSEHFVFVRDDVNYKDVKLSAYVGVRALTELGKNEISEMVSPYDDSNSTKLKNTYWNLANDEAGHVFAKDLIQTRWDYVSVNGKSCELKCSLDSVMFKARQLGLSMMDVLANETETHLSTDGFNPSNM